MKTIKTIGAAALCCVLVSGLASCSSDNEPDNGGVIELDGTRLTSVNNAKITYDKDGRVTNVGYPFDIDIDYSKGKIYTNDSDEGDEMNVKFNGKGRISSLSASWDYREDGYSYKGSGKMSISYNGDGNITKVVVESSETEKDLEDGTIEKYEEKGTQSWNWKDGNLTKAVLDYYEKEDGEIEKYNEVYTFTYSDKENAFLQMPMCISDIVNDESGYQVLALVGMFGNGPKNLPSRVVCDEDNGDHIETTDVVFTINANGTLASESDRWHTYHFGYSDIDKAGTKSLDKVKFNTRALFVRGANRNKK